jgi:2-(1,2-epoxy-1,2-dihydrophenyl)acetyl-CoA isomerase
MAESTELVTFEVRGAAGWITLNQPEKGNPFNLESVASLADAIAQAKAADVGVVVLGAEGRSFSVGGDLSSFRAAPDPSAYLAELTQALHRQIIELMELDAVVVAAVQGTAAGAGVAFATSADLVVAAQSARFTLAYTKVGLSPDGGTSLLSASIGMHRTLALALLNPVLSAEDARATGFVTQVHPDEELPGEVASLVAQLVAGSRSAQVAAKRLIRAEALASPAETLALESETMSTSAGTPDGIEGVSAFLEKRPAVFGQAG